MENNIQENTSQENTSQENTSLNKFNTSLNFCDVCGTLYNYINKNNKLFLNCRNCKQQVESKNYVVSVNNYNQTQKKINIEPNMNMIYDNTLQRTKKITCPKCSEKNVCCYRPSFNDLTLAYICIECKHYWYH